ncbi:hypothetical protein GCM10007423_00480 [Dyadobacter endophyticus]|uniref:Uncharacterized protein n=1 Tax=Dyadobacter endophyticus TaxID=1749036 RepID=A0ABQ1YCF3_9BACT|nr:hypothetical protein GCM10007423_00480 [Dyadobacter endophyticus]
MDKDTFPDFAYRGREVVRFIQAGELFTCMLENGRVIHFCPKDAEAFKSWLEANGSRNAGD